MQSSIQINGKEGKLNSLIHGTRFTIGRGRESFCGATG